MPQPNMQQMLKQVQKMQQDMMAAQESLKDEVVEASAGGGMVTVEVTGDLHVKSVKIDPRAVDPDDVELLQDMVLAAVTEAMRAAQELASSKLGGITGGLGGLGLQCLLERAAVRPARSTADRRALEAARRRRPDRTATGFSPAQGHRGGCARACRGDPRGQGA